MGISSDISSKLAERGAKNQDASKNHTSAIQKNLSIQKK